MTTQEDASVAPLASDGIDLPDDVANRMSLFYANPTPMLNTLSGAAGKLLQEVRERVGGRERDNMCVFEVMIS